jgi:hypothetical protein
MGRQAGLLLFATCDQDQLSKGTVWLCGCNAQPVPLVYGLHYPWHVEWLKTGQFLLGDFDTLSIRLSTGEVTWEMKVPMSQSYAATDNVNPVCRHRYPLRIYVIVHR